jgi:CP family cyanate transporter-like MFS transporter
VLEEARAALGMSAIIAGLLMSVPAVCFALVGFTAPRLARRYGPDGVIAAGVVALVSGLALRPFVASTTVFVVLSALALAGIAVMNVLLPVVVKQRFPQRVGAMTGLYSMALNLGASSAAAITVPLARVSGGDWRVGLGAWAILAAVAVPPWLALARDRARSVDGVPGTVSAVSGSAPDVRITRSPTAWALAVYFGLQATAAYVIIGWLPQIFRDAEQHSADRPSKHFRPPSERSRPSPR